MNFVERSIRESMNGRDLFQPLASIDALVELDAYDVALVAIERKYPVLDPDSTVFNEEVMLSVYEWMRSLNRQGVDPVSALETATFDLLGLTTTH